MEKKKGYIRKRLLMINEELKIVDQLVEQILTLHLKNNLINNDFELEIIRENINKRLILLSNTYLENNLELIGFSKIELDNIIKLHSYLVHNEILFKHKYDALITSDLLSERYYYNDVYFTASVTCILKLENL